MPSRPCCKAALVTEIDVAQESLSRGCFALVPFRKLPRFARSVSTSAPRDGFPRVSNAADLPSRRPRSRQQGRNRGRCDRDIFTWGAAASQQR